MRIPVTACAALGLLLAGCGEKPRTPAPATNAPASAGSPLDAPADYLRAMNKGQQNAVKTVDISSINQAIQLFNVDQGRNPKDLNELVAQQYLPTLPAAPNGMKLEYDAAAGKVRVVKQ